MWNSQTIEDFKKGKLCVIKVYTDAFGKLYKEYYEVWDGVIMIKYIGTRWFRPCGATVDEIFDSLVPERYVIIGIDSKSTRYIE